LEELKHLEHSIHPERHQKNFRNNVGVLKTSNVTKNHHGGRKSIQVGTASISPTTSATTSTTGEQEHTHSNAGNKPDQDANTTSIAIPQEGPLLEEDAISPITSSKSSQPLTQHCDPMNETPAVELVPLTQKHIDHILNIYETFIKPNAPLEVNLKHKTVLTIVEQVTKKQYSEIIFDSAKKEIELLLRTNTLPKFIEYQKKMSRH